MARRRWVEQLHGQAPEARRRSSRRILRRRAVPDRTGCRRCGRVLHTPHRTQRPSAKSIRTRDTWPSSPLRALRVHKEPKPPRLHPNIRQPGETAWHVARDRSEGPAVVRPAACSWTGMDPNSMPISRPSSLRDPQAWQRRTAASRDPRGSSTSRVQYWGRSLAGRVSTSEGGLRHSGSRARQASTAGQNQGAL